MSFMKMNVKNFLLKEQNHILQQAVSVCLLFISVLTLRTCIRSGMGNDIWFDEVFSMRFMEKGYGEIAAFTAADVHPPFYYWYLKTFYVVAHGIFPGVSSVVLAKMASVLPFIGIWVYAFTLIRKRMGILVMSLFLFFISAMPQIPNYTIEIRMYALAMFCITALFLHSYEIVLENKRIHWIAFFLYGIVTAYTQYYACVAVIAVYMALFVYFMRTKQKKRMGKVLLCAGGSVAAYLPWLPFFLRQLQTVSGSYWIPPLTFRSIFGCMKYIFLPVSFAGAANYVLAVCMIGIFGICFLYGIWKEKDAKVKYLLLCGVWVPVCIALTGFICSALNRPIFVYRYLIPGLGVLWLTAAVVLLKYRKEWTVLLLLIPFLLAGRSNMEGFQMEENKKLEQMERTDVFLNHVEEQSVILCNFNHVQAVTAYYLDNENVLYGGEPEALIAKLQPNCTGLLHTEKLRELVEQNEVYFLGSFEAREELLKEWAQYGVTYTEEGSYLLERYWFNVYRLKVEK